MSGGGGDNGGGIIIICESASLFSGPLLSSVGGYVLGVNLYSGVLFESFLSFLFFVPVGCRGCNCCLFESNDNTDDDDDDDGGGGGGMYISLSTLCSFSSASNSFDNTCCDSVRLWCLRLLLLLVVVVVVLILVMSLL